MSGSRFSLSLSAALVVLAFAPHAQAQQAVTCESQDGRTAECRTPFRTPVIGETLSSTVCVEGRNWGTRGRGAVWVTDGCRARFVEGGYGGGNAGHNPGYGNPGYDNGGYDNPQGGMVRCESEDGRYQECRAPRGARLVLSRQLSDTKCVEGRNWGTRGGNVWVQAGCRAEFAVAGSGGGDWGQGQGQANNRRTITCSSEDQRQQFCTWDSRWGYPRVVEQLSSDGCREGHSWGYDGRSRLWVDRGCRARFGAN